MKRFATFAALFGVLLSLSVFAGEGKESKQGKDGFRHDRHAVIAFAGCGLATGAVLHAIDNVEQSHLYLLSRWQALVAGSTRS